MKKQRISFISLNKKLVFAILMFALICSSLFATVDAHAYLLRYTTKMETYCGFYAYGSSGKTPIASDFTVLEVNARKGISDFYVITNTPVSFNLTFRFSGALHHSTKGESDQSIPYTLEYVNNITGSSYLPIQNEVAFTIAIPAETIAENTTVQAMFFVVKLNITEEQQYQRFGGNYKDTITIEVAKNE